MVSKNFCSFEKNFGSFELPEPRSARAGGWEEDRFFSPPPGFPVKPEKYIVVSVGEVVERQGIGSHSWDPPSDPRSACKRLGDSQEVSYGDTSLDVSRLGNFGLAANPETV